MKYNSELLSKEVEILKTKLLSFLAISGGSWVYGIKNENSIIFSFAIIIFSLASYGIFTNMDKLAKIESYINKLKELNNG